MNEKSYIRPNRMGIREAKTLEIVAANDEKFQAFMEYIAICDHPEIIEGSEVSEDE